MPRGVWIGIGVLVIAAVIAIVVSTLPRPVRATRGVITGAETLPTGEPTFVVTADTWGLNELWFDPDGSGSQVPTSIDSLDWSSIDHTVITIR